MPAATPSPTTIRSLLGESEMARRVLELDWSATPLGPIERWPEALLIAVGICLNSRFPMFVWWGPKLINIYNDGYIPMLGGRHPRALGRPARDSWEDIWADVGPQAELVMNEGKATWNERVHLRMERHGYPEDTWFTWSYSPIRDKLGEICGLYCAVQEDTPRVRAEAERDRLDRNLQESEKRFRALVNASSDVIYRMNPDWTEMRQLAGRDFIADTSAPERSWMAKYILPDDHARVSAAIAQAIGSRAAFQLEHRVRRVDGSVGWTYSRAVPILAADGEIVEWFGAASDVTARKEAEESLRASEASLKEADRRKDEFLAMLAHELRNPLAPISNAVQAMRLDPHPQNAQALGVMDRQIRQMVRMVDDLLDVSRITQGKVALKKEPVRLDEVLDAALETARPLIENREQALKVLVPPGIWLDADRARLAQVFANVLHNASKFSARHGAICIGARQDAGGVTIDIADSGVGIPKEQLASIFDIFAQVENPIERAHGGLGIGLTIVRTLLEMHGGEVQALSDGVGKGATFRMRLPTRPAPLTASPAGAEAVPAPSEPLRLLIVDDNKDSAQTLGMMLKLLGHSVEVRYDGPSALQAAPQFGPDAVFLDIGMPGMSGYEVCKRLRASGSGDLVVIAQTGWGDPLQRSRSQEAGFDHHLVKPVDLATLQGVLSSIAPRAR